MRVRFSPRGSSQARPGAARTSTPGTTSSATLNRCDAIYQRVAELFAFCKYAFGAFSCLIQNPNAVR